MSVPGSQPASRLKVVTKKEYSLAGGAACERHDWRSGIFAWYATAANVSNPQRDICRLGTVGVEDLRRHVAQLKLGRLTELPLTLAALSRVQSLHTQGFGWSERSKE